MPFDQRVAQLRDNSLTFFEGWHRSDYYSEANPQTIENQLQDILRTDLENSRS